MMKLPPPWETRTGKPCNCPEQIPGLDAIGCSICKVWWVSKEHLAIVSEPKPRRVRRSKSPEVA